jgi:hypothetical protein
MIPTPRVSLSIRDNDTTDIFTWSAAAHPSLSARVNGVRVWSAPGQPFQLALEKSKLPFLSFQLPAAANETIAIHVDLQALTGGLAAKRKREEEDAPSPKKQRTDTARVEIAPAPVPLTDAELAKRLRKREQDREYRDRKRKEKEQLAAASSIADPDELDFNV